MILDVVKRPAQFMLKPVSKVIKMSSPGSAFLINELEKSQAARKARKMAMTKLAEKELIKKF